MLKGFIPTWLKWAILYYAIGRAVTHVAEWIMDYWVITPTTDGTAFVLGLMLVIGLIAGQTFEQIWGERDEDD